MGKNFMEAGTEIDGTITKIDECLNRISNSIAEACVDRVKSDKVGNGMSNDIKKLISDLPQEYQTQVLLGAITALCRNFSGGGSTKPSSKQSGNRDYFARRGL